MSNADDVAEPGSYDGYRDWLYPDPKRPCICDHAIVPGGRLHGTIRVTLLQ